MLTLKLKYTIENDQFIFDECLFNIRRKQTNINHILVNKQLNSNIKLSELKLRKTLNNYNNIKLNCWFQQSAIKESIQSYNSFIKKFNEHIENRDLNFKKLNKKLQQNKITLKTYNKKRKYIESDIKLIFGGKYNFEQRIKNNISKEQYKEKRLLPLYSIGETQFGNRFFKLTENLNIIFKPDKQHKFNLKLIYGKNQKIILEKLFNLQLQKNIAITYKLDKQYIYIIYDEILFKTNLQNKIISNRILSIDMNPNYLGLSIVDWKTSSNFKLIYSVQYSLKYFSDQILILNKLNNISSDDKKRKYLNRKRKYEIIKISQNIITLFKHYNCHLLIIEDLKMKSEDKNKGKDYNRLCNCNWIRTTFINQLIKQTNVFNIKLLKVKPQYSSFIGNLIFKSLNKDDAILSSIEIGRRGYEFYNQYISKTKEIKKNIIQLDINDFKINWRQSLEELSLTNLNINPIKLYNSIKTKKELPQLNGNPYKVRFYSKNRIVKRFYSKYSNIQLIYN